VPTPTPTLYAKTPLDELENAVDDGDDDDDGDETDTNNIKRVVPIENRILRSISVLILFLVFIVVLLGGIHNSLVSVRVEEAAVERVMQVAAAAVASPNDHKKTSDQQRTPDGLALQELIDQEETSRSSSDQIGKELELKRRKNLEQKLENSISKRNRILDILLKQQDQQTLILTRQKEILQILSERKKR